MLPVVLGEIIGPDILVILAVIALLFGATKIPDIARNLGKAKGEFERGAYESQQSLAEQKRKDASKNLEDVERDRVLKAAAELGIPTEGRSITDIKADVRAKMT
ncbi:MAG: sec-independent protein translocase protein TatA [Thermoplasmata archaeon]|jgi:sec-independent protein translocase protein TatA|nr:sec-independent protein translocase protein TatA [Thermoplasmata archaeon]